MDPEQLLCAKEVATLLGVSERTAAAMMRRGEIVAFKLHGAAWRTRRADVINYVLEQMRAGRAVCERKPRAA